LDEQLAAQKLELDKFKEINQKAIGDKIIALEENRKFRRD